MEKLLKWAITIFSEATVGLVREIKGKLSDEGYFCKISATQLLGTVVAGNNLISVTILALYLNIHKYVHLVHLNVHINVHTNANKNIHLNVYLNIRLIDVQVHVHF